MHCHEAENVTYFLLKYLIKQGFECRTFTCSGVFSQCGISTFTAVKDVNISFTTV